MSPIGDSGRVSHKLTPEARGGTAWWLAWLFDFAHMRELDGLTPMGASESDLNTGT